MRFIARALIKVGILKNDLDYHLLRASMVIVFLFFGYQKWFEYEAQALLPYIGHGPLISWMYPVFGVRGATYFLGIAEWLFGALLFAGYWNKRLGILGALGACLTFIATTTIIPFMPDGWAASAGGFPAMTEKVAFLMKDLVLFAVSVYLLRQDLIRASLFKTEASDSSTTIRQHIRPKTSVIRTDVVTKLLATIFLTVTATLAQSSDRLPVTDEQKIVEALRAGPTFITKVATVLDWPSSPGGEYRILRKGSDEWTCLPAIPGYPHDAIDSAFKEEPGCYDPMFLRAMHDSIAGRTPHIDRMGISYMYLGAWKSAKGGSGHEFHVGPHLMVVGPDQDKFQGFNRDATNGMPYAAHLPNRTELFVVIPVRQWNE